MGNTDAQTDEKSERITKTIRFGRDNVPKSFTLAHNIRDSTRRFPCADYYGPTGPLFRFLPGQSGSALGGAGGGGGCVYIQRLPVQGTATLAANITVGSYVTVYYTGSYGGTTVATAYWGSAGGNGDFSGPNSCVGGAGVFVVGCLWLCRQTRHKS